MIVATALMCLSLNVYHESRGEPIMGQYAVALVTMNRADKNSKYVCEETFKPKQFSWANRGVKKVKGGWKLSKSLEPKDDIRWAKAKIIAKQTLSGKMPDITKGATFYHADYVKPVWRHKLVPVKQVGHHIFYALN